MKSKDIPCLSFKTWTDCGYEYDCGHEFSGEFSCEDCVCNGGTFDPRTGKQIKVEVVDE